MMQYTLSKSKGKITIISSRQVRIEMVEKSGIYGSIQQGSSVNSALTIQERLKLCCKLTYKPRSVKTKGAILMLVCNYLVMSVFGVLLHKDHRRTSIVWLAGVGLIPPLAGWIVDTWTGRYKLICCCIWIMWIASVLATTSSVIAQLVDQYRSIDAYVLKVLLTIMAIGLGGYISNIVQFGIDQLNGASTTEITSFTVWCTLTIIDGGKIITFVFVCLSDQLKTIEFFLVCLYLSISLIVLYQFNQWLIKEPVKQNPYKLVYKIIMYAIKNKRPRCRSAFTYCEDELPSRIDLGKSKYGGPFTTEQVEDVKTMLRFIPLVVVGGAFSGGFMITRYYRNQVVNLISDFGDSFVLKDHVTSSKLSPKECYIKAIYTHIMYFSTIVLVVLNEVLLYPIFERCMSRIQSLNKVLFGMVLQIAKTFTLMAYEVTSRHNFVESSGLNATIPCLFNASQGTLKSSFDSRWIILPDFLGSASTLVFFIGVIQFLSAQVPYFMKGVIVGVAFLSFLLCGAAWFTTIELFEHFLSGWGTGTISCGFWYALLLAAIQVCIFLIMTILKMRYKQRTRDDLLPNEHFFAERYYSAIT